MEKRWLLILMILLFLISGCAENIIKEQQKKCVNEGEFCGGIAGIMCCQGLTCQYDGDYPDAGGECIKGLIKKTQPIQEEKTEKILSTNPVDELSNELINKLGADCKSKTTELEKANCILDWQEKNIFWCYTHPQEMVMPKMFETGYPDCVVDMQFQQMEPGSFPVSKIFELKLRNNKLFGACYTYATTYCAIARWNGLKCRVMAVKIITPMDYSASKGDYGAGYCGAAPKSYLDALGLDCEEWRTKDWIINEDHYWAEVLIDGQWKIMEKPEWAYMHDTQKNIINAGRTYGDKGW